MDFCAGFTFTAWWWPHVCNKHPEVFPSTFPAQENAGNHFLPAPCRWQHQLAWRTSTSTTAAAVLPQINFSELGFHEKAFHFFLGGSSFKSVQTVGAKSESHSQTNSARLLLIWIVIEKVSSDHFCMISSGQRVVKVLESPLLAIFKYCVMNKWKQSWWWLSSTADYQHTSV